jgi:hypothetical protein
VSHHEDPSHDLPPFSPRDAWLTHRLLRGVPLNGDLAHATAALRPIFERLAASPLAERRGIADDWLRGRPDADFIQRAVVAADPDGPMPVAGFHRPPGSLFVPDAKLTCAAHITEREVQWLWRNRVPLGMLTTLSGDPKLGKSLVSLAITASVTRGAPLPGDNPPDRPGSVILLSAEDDPARTIVPRLRAAGADLRRVHILESIIQPGIASDDPREALPPVERMPCLLDHDLAVIEAKAAALGDCRLIVVDPVSAYLGGKDDHRNAELRSVLSPLKAMAERLDVAMILVTHLSKAAGANGKYRVMGSIAYVGACRANYLCVRDKDDPSGRRVLMLDNGCNLAPTQTGLAYVIGDSGDGPAVEWIPEPVEMDADTALRRLAEAEAEQARPEQAAERRECEEWLRDYLSQGRQLAKHCQRAANAAGFKRTTLHRAKHRVGVVSQREGFGRESECFWVMPESPADGRAGSIDSTPSHRFQEF